MVAFQAVLPNIDVYICGGNLYFTMFAETGTRSEKSMTYNNDATEFFATPMKLSDFLFNFNEFAVSYASAHKARFEREVQACGNDDNKVNGLIEHEYMVCFGKFTKLVKALQIHSFHGGYEQSFNLDCHSIEL